MDTWKEIINCSIGFTLKKKCNWINRLFLEIKIWLGWNKNIIESIGFVWNKITIKSISLFKIEVPHVRKLSSDWWASLLNKITFWKEIVIK
jgi:hypothetical protein